MHRVERCRWSADGSKKLANVTWCDVRISSKATRRLTTRRAFHHQPR
jgi:hypothetical protein